MLLRKMLREITSNLGQFISILILSFLATFIYAGFESNVVGSGKAVRDFHEKTNIADAWLYSEGFTKENLTEVKKLDCVEQAQLRTELRGTTVEYGGAQADIYLMDESVILKPYLYEGAKDKKNRLAKQMGVGVGDKVYWHIYSKNKWYESEIGLINRTPETAGITFLRKDFEETGCEYKPTTILTHKNIMNYKNRDGVAGVYDMEEIKEAFVKGYEVIKYLFYMMMAFSVITVVVVLYNSGNLSFHERLNEFASLKVMGLSTAKIRRILNQENIWFAVIGILLGSPFGKPSLLAMMNSNGDEFDYYVNIPAYLYVLSAAFILAIAVAVSVMFSKKIKKLDMVGTLKELE